MAVYSGPRRRSWGILVVWFLAAEVKLPMLVTVGQARKQESAALRPCAALSDVFFSFFFLLLLLFSLIPPSKPMPYVMRSQVGSRRDPYLATRVCSCGWCLVDTR